jgi:hypothetical protein
VFFRATNSIRISKQEVPLLGDVTKFGSLVYGAGYLKSL